MHSHIFLLPDRCHGNALIQIRTGRAPERHASQALNLGTAAGAGVFARVAKVRGRWMTGAARLAVITTVKPATDSILINFRPATLQAELAEGAGTHLFRHGIRGF